MREWIEAESPSFCRKNGAKTLTRGLGSWDSAVPELADLGELDGCLMLTDTLLLLLGPG